jgi:hypothetical protein
MFTRNLTRLGLRSLTLARRSARVYTPKFSQRSPLRYLSTDTGGEDGKFQGQHATKKFQPAEERTPEEEAALKSTMGIEFTCNKCETRQAKKMNRHSYNSGVVIITCNGCKAMHLIADHLGWFDDNSVTIESIMADKGENVTMLSEEGDVSFDSDDTIQKLA